MASNDNPQPVDRPARPGRLILLSEWLPTAVMNGGLLASGVALVVDTSLAPEQAVRRHEFQSLVRGIGFTSHVSVPLPLTADELRDATVVSRPDRIEPPALAPEVKVAEESQVRDRNATLD